MPERLATQSWCSGTEIAALRCVTPTITTTSTIHVCAASQKRALELGLAVAWRVSNASAFAVLEHQYPDVAYSTRLNVASQVGLMLATEQPSVQRLVQRCILYDDESVGSW